jgi:hypothetical protein
VGIDYLIYYDSYSDAKYGAAKTSDFKTFEDVSSQISLPLGHKHGSIFMVSEKIVDALKNRK